MDRFKFGMLIKERRKKAGYSSQESFSLEFKKGNEKTISQQGVQSWEAGMSFPGEEHWPKIEELLDLDMTYYKVEVDKSKQAQIQQYATNNSEVYQSAGDMTFGGSGGSNVPNISSEKQELIALIVEYAPDSWVLKSLEKLRKIREITNET